uniref:Gst7 n=1 Tax=Arundo donax TaxID=35708 RepID=A0A0A9BPW7_ARUDO
MHDFKASLELYSFAHWQRAGYSSSFTKLTPITSSITLRQGPNVQAAMST